MREKRGKDALEQAASMMMMVSITSLLDKIFLSVACSYSSLFSSFNAGHYNSGLGSPGLFKASRPVLIAN